MPPGVRWTLLALVVVTVAAGVRVGALIAFSNTPYRTEIAADVAAWEAAAEKRDALAEEALAVADELPAILRVRYLPDVTFALLDGGLSERLPGRMRAFYAELPQDMRSTGEEAFAPELMAAEDGVAFLYDVLLAESAWLAKPANTRAAAVISERIGTRLEPPPARMLGLIAIASANAHRGDASLAFDLALGGIETMASMPRPCSVNVLLHTRLQATALAIVAFHAAGQTAIDEAEWSRLDAALNALMDAAMDDETMRVTAGTWLPPDLLYRPKSRFFIYYVGLYPCAVNYRAITSGAAPAPFDVYGMAIGQRDLSRVAADLQFAANFLDSAKAGSRFIQAVRRFEADHGRLPDVAESEPFRDTLEQPTIHSYQPGRLTIFLPHGYFNNSATVYLHALTPPRGSDQ